jgi:hypothetical protein
MKFEIKKASKKNTKLRMGIYGISKSGKTLTSLYIASGMSEKILLIDTQGGQSNFHADKVSFDILELNHFSSKSYGEALKWAAKNNYPFVIIDSFSDEYKWMLEAVDKSPEKDGRRAWAHLDPDHEILLHVIKQYPGHVIATMRSNLENIIEKDEANGQKQKKACSGFIQKKGVEATFDFMMEIDINSVGHIWGGRDHFKNKKINEPGKQLGEEILAFINEGENIVLATEEQIKMFDSLCSTLNYTEEQINRKLEGKGFYSKESLPSDEIQKFIGSLEDAVKAKIAKDTQGVANANQ